MDVRYYLVQVRVKFALWLHRAGTMTSNGTANGHVDAVKAPACSDAQRFAGVTRPYAVRACCLVGVLLLLHFMQLWQLLVALVGALCAFADPFVP